MLFRSKAFNQTGNWLPEETLAAFREYKVGIKGPLTTPVGGGIRSLNVALRQLLDLYVCLRPVRWFRGVPSPVRAPEKVDMVIFRENCEDIYAGIGANAQIGQGSGHVGDITISAHSSVQSSLKTYAMAGGIEAGPMKPNQPVFSNPGKPLSATVGTSGSIGVCCAVVTASGRRYFERNSPASDAVLEIDLAEGGRGSRTSAVARKLCAASGAVAAAKTSTLPRRTTHFIPNLRAEL